MASDPSGSHPLPLALSSTSFAVEGEGSHASRSRALDDLYRNEQSAVLEYLSCRVGIDTARDLTQEVFLKAANSKHLLALTNPSGYLRTIARNTMIDHIRRSKSRIATLPLPDATCASCPADQERLIHANETRREIQTILATLPPKTALIFRMSRFEQMTYRQIQRALGISLPTVDYHMMKALARFRDELGIG